MTDLQLYRGDPLIINENIIVRQPTLGEIADFGEEIYMSMVFAICATPSDYMVALNDIGVDFEEITDFDLFIALHQMFTPKETSILFGNLDLSAYIPAVRNEDCSQILKHPDTGSVIDVAIYMQIVDYIRRINGLSKNVVKPGNAHAKEYLIKRERQKLKWQKNKKFESVLQPLISAMCNCEQFKFSYADVWDVPIYVFYDSVKRIQKIKESEAILSGIYAGTVDGKKIESDKLDWLGSLK